MRTYTIQKRAGRSWKDRGQVESKSKQKALRAYGVKECRVDGTGRSSKGHLFRAIRAS
jgi:hypothetical protein